MARIQVNTFEATLRSGAKVRFRAVSLRVAPGVIEWTSYPSQTDERLSRLNYDEVVAVERLR
jgi:hypothetical protein